MKRPLFTFPIPSNVLHSLHKAGYRTFQDLFNSCLEVESEVIKILETNGLSWQKFKSLAKPVNSMTCKELFQAEKQYDSIPTFSEALDEVLGGGVPVGNVVQVCGPPGSGKTQLVMQLCVDVQIPVSMGGLNGSTIFIDSERGFTKHRLSEIASATVDHCKRVGEMYNLTDDLRTLTVENILNGIRYLEVTGHVELLAAVNLLDKYVSENKVKLVVIDSIVMPLLTLQNTLDRTRYQCRIVKILLHIALRHLVSVVIVNDMTTWISSTDDKILVPSLGESVSHLSSIVLLLAKHSNFHSAVVQKSSFLPRRVANFLILKEGIRDVNSD